LPSSKCVLSFLTTRAHPSKSSWNQRPEHLSRAPSSSAQKSERKSCQRLVLMPAPTTGRTNFGLSGIGDSNPLEGKRGGRKFLRLRITQSNGRLLFAQSLPSVSQPLDLHNSLARTTTDNIPQYTLLVSSHHHTRLKTRTLINQSPSEKWNPTRSTSSSTCDPCPS
jgi:hypothetical protein